MPVTAAQIAEFAASNPTPEQWAAAVAAHPDVTAQAVATALNAPVETIQANAQKAGITFGGTSGAAPSVTMQPGSYGGQVSQGTLAGLQTQGAASPLDVFKHDFKVDAGGTMMIDGQPQYIQTGDGPQPNPAWAAYGDPSKPGSIAWAGAFMTNPAYANLVAGVKNELATTGQISPQTAMQIARTGNPNQDDSPFMKALVNAGVFGMLGAGIAGGGLMGGNLAEYGGNLAASGGSTAIGSAGNDFLNVDPSAPGYVPPNTPQIPATGQLPSIPSQGALSGLQNLPTPSAGVDPSAPGYVPPNTPQVPATAQLPATTPPPPLGSVDPSAPGYTPPNTAQVPATGQLPATTPPPPLGSAPGGPTGINPTNGLPITPAATAGTALSRLLNGTATPADLASLGIQAAGTIAAGAAGADASRSYYNTLSDLAKNQWEVGAPSRARYEASMQPGFDPTTIPGYKGLLDSTWKGALSGLSAQGGNPFGNPGGLIQATSDVQNKTAAPFLLNYQNQNANTGAIGALAGGYAGSQSNAAAAGGGQNSAYAGTLGSLLNPQQGSAFNTNDITNIFRNFSRTPA